MTSSWSIEEFDGSQEDDNMVSNQIAFTFLFSDNCMLVQESASFVATSVVCNNTIPKFVATESMTATNNKSESNFESEDESLQEAYEKMYTQ